jgi:uncharacterized membrane protein YGL010W
MIVVAVAVLLARPAIDIAGLSVSAATLATIASALYYLRLDLALGLLMSALLAASLYFAQWAAMAPTLTWLAIGVGLFVVGWVIQFIGHYFEGRKPAFVDDLMGLIIGPLFVAAEAVFALGLRRNLEATIVAAAGPTHSGLRSRAPAR